MLMLLDLLQLITNPIYRITRINAHLLWLHLYFYIQNRGATTLHWKPIFNTRVYQRFKLKHIFHRYSNAIQIQLHLIIFSFYFSNLEILFLSSYNWTTFCCNKKAPKVFIIWVYIITLESLRWRAFRRRRLKNIFRPS